MLLTCVHEWNSKDGCASVEFTSLYVAPVRLIVYTQKHACIEIIYFTCPVQHCFSAYVLKIMYV